MSKHRAYVRLAAEITRAIGAIASAWLAIAIVSGWIEPLSNVTLSFAVLMILSLSFTNQP